MPDLNPDQFDNHQLRMFAPAHELLSSIESGRLQTSDDILEGQWNTPQSEAKRMPHSQMWRIKRREAQMEGTTESIHKEGIKTPLHVFHTDEPTKYEGVGSHLYDGHHRLIVAYDKDPNTEIPLRHSNSETYSADLKAGRLGT